MPNIGPLELAILLVIVLLIFGPKRLPGLGRQLGSGMREFKESITGRHRDDDDYEDEDVAPAGAASRHELSASPPAGGAEVAAGETRPQDQPASRADG